MVLKCPQCGKRYQVPDGFSQALAKCAKCKSTFSVSECVVGNEVPQETVIVRPPTSNVQPEARSPEQDKVFNGVAAAIVAGTLLYMAICALRYPELWLPGFGLLGIAAGVYLIWTGVIHTDVPDVVYPAIYMPVIVVGLLALVIVLTGDAGGQFMVVTYVIAMAVLSAVCFAAALYLLFRVITVYVKGNWKTLFYALTICICFVLAANRLMSRAENRRQISKLEKAAAGIDAQWAEYRQAHPPKPKPVLVAVSRPVFTPQRIVQVPTKTAAAPIVVVAAPVVPKPEIKKPPPTLEEYIKIAADEPLVSDAQKSYGAALAEVRRKHLPGFLETKKQLGASLAQQERQYAAAREQRMKEMTAQEAQRDRARGVGHRQFHSGNAKTDQSAIAGLRDTNQNARAAISNDLRDLDVADNVYIVASEIPIHMDYKQFKKAVLAVRRAKEEAKKLVGRAPTVSGFASRATDAIRQAEFTLLNTALPQ